MINFTTINISGQPNDILDLKKGYNKTLRNIPTVSEDFLEVHENCVDHLSDNLKLNNISMLIFFEFYCKIKRNQLEIVLEETCGSQHKYFGILDLTFGGRILVTRRFRLCLNSQTRNQIRDWSILIDFCTKKPRVVTPV